MTMFSQSGGMLRTFTDYNLWYLIAGFPTGDPSRRSGRWKRHARPGTAGASRVSRRQQPRQGNYPHSSDLSGRWQRHARPARPVQAVSLAVNNLVKVGHETIESSDDAMLRQDMPGALRRVETAATLLQQASDMLRADPYSGPARYCI
ncbi:Uncharacterized protein OBRU01_07694 [Operophtera brumata]|uniref:Vinculin n=1 Tax=Operophtera brumata TaxID=104452 RepID=A0A0L7LIR2_OPEBR|nr:Uncharacterized protein OBRU01_07694 [Operophtera brumata]